MSLSDHRAHMCPVVARMNPVHDTNSVEPGLPVVRRGEEVQVYIWHSKQ